ncbi:MAG: hydratase [Bradyrhizobiaceae bacterium]|nr:hydratase [Bradyrhizobiaceae bacterium]
MSAISEAGAGATEEEINAIAAEVFALLDSGRSTTSFSARHPGFDLTGAYRVTAALRALREGRGEKAVGRKIGFTNRTIWPEYNVYAPIWGYVYDRTVHELARAGDSFSLARFSDPRIEPEIVFGIGRAPAPDMDAAALFGCIEWVAHGFEIVQSIFPGWKFSPADTVAVNGLHGALLIGSRHKLTADGDWARNLETFEIDLFRNSDLADHGRAANVLDGPLHALRHLVELLAQDRVNPPLAASEIVTTGTLTRALPVRAGEVWHTALTGVPLEGARIRFA